jgi:hypothetical protein
MGLSVETPVRALAFCLDATCPGNVQAPCDGVLNVTTHTYLDAGGDLGPHTERSMEYLRFADEDDRTCEVCGGAREISLQERPVYPKAGGDPRSQQSSGAEVNLMALMMKQNEELAALKAEMAQKANRSGPKPKPAEGD